LKYFTLTLASGNFADGNDAYLVPFYVYFLSQISYELHNNKRIYETDNLHSANGVLLGIWPVIDDFCLH